MSDPKDPHNLQRFVEAQESEIEIEQVKEELRAGNKETHWMWYVFPQVAGLGKSQKSKRYAIKSQDEAEAYLEHDVLGPRLRECTEIVVGIENKPAYDIFHSPDNKKFRSSMTLFATVAEGPSPFRTALNKFFDDPCDFTLDFLSDSDQ